MCLPYKFTKSCSKYKPHTPQKSLNYTKFSIPSWNFTTFPRSLRPFFWCIFFMLLVLSIKHKSQFHDRHKNHKILCLPWIYYMIYFCVKYTLNLSIGMIFLPPWHQELLKTHNFYSTALMLGFFPYFKTDISEAIYRLRLIFILPYAVQYLLIYPLHFYFIRHMVAALYTAFS